MDKKRILIIDDETEMVEMETVRLKASGYEVTAACDGPSGLDKVKFWQPDLILLDIMLPKMDGYQVCAALKKDPQTHNIPIILVSATDQKYDSNLGKKAGADAYFTKPFESVTLLAKIRELLKKRA